MNEILSPMPGVIVKIHVSVGDEVQEDTEVMVLEAMKMENLIFAEYDGKVAQILVKEKEAVKTGAVLLTVESA